MIDENYSGWIDLFGWGTGDEPTKYSNDNAEYSAWSDWGNNTISNGGSGWRTLTSTEWNYLFTLRTTASGIRFALARVNGVNGVILLPDDWDADNYALTNPDKNVSFTTNVISESDWTNKFEANGAVFLSASGERIEKSCGSVNSGCMYWSSTPYDDANARFVFIYPTYYLQPSHPLDRYRGYSVRLVKNLTNEEKQAFLPKASVTSSPTAASNLIYNGNSQYLLTAAAGAATGGSVYYRLAPDESWWSSYDHYSITAINAGTYTVQWYVGANTGCYLSSEVKSIEVTIAQADYTPSGSYSISGNNLSYTGSSQALVSVTGSVTDGTIWYKLGDGDWTEEIPTAATLGDYHVWYKVVPTNSNYKDTEPVEVVASITIPTITDHSNASTIETVLATNPTNLMVERTIYADGEYNTICLPFAVSASDLANDQYPLYGYERLKAFKGASISGTAPDLSIDIFVEDVTAMEAGKPYLISYPAANTNIVNPVFHFASAPTYLTTPGFVSADGVTFQGMFAQVHINPYETSREQDYLFLGANSQLNWPADNANSMRGFRAYFIIDRNAIPAQVAPRGTHARFVNAPKQPTAIENTELNTQAQKLLENGQLIILKNGIKYNAQGQVLK